MIVASSWSWAFALHNHLVGFHNGSRGCPRNGKQGKATNSPEKIGPVLKIAHYCTIIVQPGFTPRPNKSNDEVESPVTGRRACPSVLWATTGSTDNGSRALWRRCATSRQAKRWRRPWVFTYAFPTWFYTRTPVKERVGAKRRRSRACLYHHHASSRRGTHATGCRCPLKSPE